MRRRNFFTLLGGAALAWPCGVRAQKPAMPVIGFLVGASPAQFAPYVAGFRRGLSETGYVEGKNVAIEFRSAEGHYDRALAGGRSGPPPGDNPVCVRSRRGARAAKAATSTIPIVFTTGRDPVDMGLVASLSHPGGNLTGINFFTSELREKRLELLHALVPKATVIAYVVNPNGTTGSRAQTESRTQTLPETARALGLQLRFLSASNAQEIDAAFATLGQLRPGALLVDADIFFNARREQIVALAARNKVPAIYEGREYVAPGGLMSCGASLSEAWRQAGIYTGKILNGAKPADLPIMQSTKIEMVINTRTAKALGLTIPQSLLLRADEVIQ